MAYGLNTGIWKPNMRPYNGCTNKFYVQKSAGKVPAQSQCGNPTSEVLLNNNIYFHRFGKVKAAAQGSNS
jgi:hypothetical protein